VAVTKSNIEVTNFSKGLITEVSPLTFPPDASVDEINFTLNRDGTRSRRLGIDYEDGYALNDTLISATDFADLPAGAFRWENVGENPELIIAVVWIGNRLYFHDFLEESISASVVAPSIALDGFYHDSKLSMTQVDGSLVVAAGLSTIATVTYNTSSGTMGSSYNSLLIRDLFGVEAIQYDFFTGETNLREGNNIQFRTPYTIEGHVYNLRNQSFGPPRRPHREESHSWDPIENFHTAAYYDDDEYFGILPVNKSGGGDFNTGVFPSNSDIVHYAMAPDADDNPPTDNFMARTLFDLPIGSVEAPRGYMIIDALARGTSRLTEFKKLMARHPRVPDNRGKLVRGLVVDINTLPSDTTPSGATVVEEFAGRVFYAGFTGEVIDGDSFSPKLSGYVLFSQLVESTGNINKCYQAGDPTSEESPDIVDTDGGYIKISGAFGIRSLVNLNAALAVLADNGVWVIQGGTTDAGFSATGFQVTKISEYPLVSKDSIVVVDNKLLYWSDDGIYTLGRDEFGSYSVQNLTQPTIQKFFESIPNPDKESCRGVFDQFERKVRWIYGDNKELVLDVNLGAFTPNQIASAANYPSVVAPVKAAARAVGLNVDEVVVSGVTVQANAVDVSVSTRIRIAGSRGVKYLSFLDIGGSMKYTFSEYTDQTFSDWVSVDNVGLDAPAYLISGYLTGGDTQRGKTIPCLTTHFVQSESGFDGDYELLNPSSCLIQAQWNWTNSANSNKWGTPRQAYRLTRAFFSDDFTFDNGQSIVSTKNKLRGRGKTVSVKFSTEPAKDCQVLGWAMSVNVEQNT